MKLMCHPNVCFDVIFIKEYMCQASLRFIQIIFNRSLQLRMPNVVRQSDELTNYSAPDVQQCNKTPLVSIPTQTKVSAFWENVANSEMLTQKNDIENKGSLDDTRDIDFNLSSSEPITGICTIHAINFKLKISVHPPPPGFTCLFWSKIDCLILYFK